jgi:hypothetical protein
VFVEGEAMARTEAEGSKAERYGVVSESAPEGFGVDSDHSLTVLSVEQETNVSDAGERARHVTVEVWPEK